MIAGVISSNTWKGPTVRGQPRFCSYFHEQAEVTPSCFAVRIGYLCAGLFQGLEELSVEEAKLRNLLLAGEDHATLVSGS